MPDYMIPEEIEFGSDLPRTSREESRLQGFRAGDRENELIIIQKKLKNKTDTLGKNQGVSSDDLCLIRMFGFIEVLKRDINKHLLLKNKQ